MNSTINYSFKNKNYYKKVSFSIIKYIFICLFLIFVAYSFFTLNFQLSSNGLSLFLLRIKKIFSFEQNNNYENYIFTTFKFTLKTVQYTSLGTLIGFLFAILTAFLSSKTFHKNLLLVYLIKVFVLILRSIPVLVVLEILRNGFGDILQATLVLSWFTWLWAHKYLEDIFENSDYNTFKNNIFLGKNKWISFFKNVNNSYKNKIIVLFLYSFESNIRWTSILSSAGLFGLGYFLQGKNTLDYKYIGIPLLWLTITLLINELIGIFLNKIIFFQKALDKKTKFSKRIFLRPTLYFWILSIIYLSLAISVLFIINYKDININLFYSTFGKYLDIDFIYIKENIYKLFISVYDILKISSIAIFISYLLSLFIAYLGNNIIGNKYNILLIKLFLLICRIIPSVIVFILFNMFFNRFEIPILIVMIFSSTRAMAKFFIESLNSVYSVGLSNMIKTKYFSKTKIFFKYILPNAKNEIISFAFYRFENVFRSMISFGALSTIGIGYILSNVANLKIEEADSRVSAISFVIMIFIILIELINIFYKIFYDKRTFKKK
ncbi:ABC-type phosphate/phosphonate transport system, permease component [Mycoplasmopsis maculosa]|uniref:ABC-type phosphate/phosphonate transport system, permease component n=1 Tax=Mycoplasmopsis maculosa TaxID=114885 RepID=A0A449B3I8_9BACT|nr:ABC transporter permease subunit [Mycoplasmopsis maculosa]VEU75146.1 ABC-type phosphate/phosphonate transport system, permease component [Mycoplasmopsis maculosa]